MKKPSLDRIYIYIYRIGVGGIRTLHGNVEIMRMEIVIKNEVFRLKIVCTKIFIYDERAKHKNSCSLLKEEVKEIYYY